MDVVEAALMRSLRGTDTHYQMKFRRSPVISSNHTIRTLEPQRAHRIETIDNARIAHGYRLIL